MRLSHRLLALVATSIVVGGSLIASCGGGDPVRSTPAALADGGDQQAGRRAIIEHGCGSCHRILGIPNANSLVGPPLDAWSRRSFIAGTLPNSAQNLKVWLENPQQVRPGSAMPNLNLEPEVIADVVAYLFALD